MRPKIAMLAYACDPNGSGEHWLGWGWAETATRFADVTLFTTVKSRDAVEQRARDVGIESRFVKIAPLVRWSSGFFGPVGNWWRKIAWAKRAALRVADANFDVIHQTTFHTFRVPFYAAGLGVPSIWGPVAGGESCPSGFDEILGSAAAGERRRARQNQAWLAWRPVQTALRNAKQLYVSNHSTLKFLPDFARTKARVVPPNTLRSEESANGGLSEPVIGRLRLLFAGNCVATRGLPLVFRAMANLENVYLTVAGTGPALPEWREAAAIAGPNVTFVGQVSRANLRTLYTQTDALAFPALRDSGGSALLEAMSLKIPIVCLDWAGPGEMIDEESGIKIPVESVEQVVLGIREALIGLRDSVEFRRTLAEKAFRRVNELFTWDAKRAILEESCRAIMSGIRTE